MSNPPRVYEVEIKVTAHGQEPSSIHREYVTTDAQSTHGAAGEIFGAIDAVVKRKFKTVASED